MSNNHVPTARRMPPPYQNSPRIDAPFFGFTL
jgi:hypothetical protein